MLSQSPRTACGCHEFPLLPHCTCLAPMSVRSKMEKVFGEEEPAALVFVKCWCPGAKPCEAFYAAAGRWQDAVAARS